MRLRAPDRSRTSANTLTHPPPPQPSPPAVPPSRHGGGGCQRGRECGRESSAPSVPLLSPRARGGVATIRVHLQTCRQRRDEADAAGERLARRPVRLVRAAAGSVRTRPLRRVRHGRSEAAARLDLAQASRRRRGPGRRRSPTLSSRRRTRSSSSLGVREARSTSTSTTTSSPRCASPCAAGRVHGSQLGARGDCGSTPLCASLCAVRRSRSRVRYGVSVQPRGGRV